MKKHFLRRTFIFTLAIVMLLSTGSMAFAAIEYSEQVPETAGYDFDLPLMPEFSMTVDTAELVLEEAAINSRAMTANRTSISDIEGGTEIAANVREAGSELFGEFSTGAIVPLSGDFYQSFTSFITQPQGWAYLIFDVFPGEVLHVRLDTPNAANIDYDLFLYRMVGDFFQAVDSSMLWTRINGAYGTLSETVGWVNTTGTIQSMAIIVESAVGFSTTLPFILHVAANTGFEQFEADALTRPRILPLGENVTRTGIMDTRADSDWFRIVVPANRNFDSINVALDAASVSTGHVVELYRIVNNGAQRVPIVDGEAAVTTGNHYIRVHNNAALLTGVQYQLTVSTVLPPPPEPSITLSASRNSVESGVQFQLYGEVVVNGPSTIDLIMVPQSTGAELPLLLNEAVFSSGQISFGWIYFPPNFLEDTFTFIVRLRDNSGALVATASTTVQHIAPRPPAPTVARVAELSFTPSDAGVVYSNVSNVGRFRIRGSSTVRVNGRAFDANNNAIADANLRLTFVNDGWTNNPTMRNSYRYVTTDASGRFSTYISVNPPAGVRTYVFGAARPTLHTFDTGSFEVADVNNNYRAVTVPATHRLIFIFANSRPL
ncbi:MAG: hypothetical protein FWC13_13125 [Oscillospiraceae bacterium]|nr:hypothetical protein [Oscillospiraceae bacterium]